MKRTDSLARQLTVSALCLTLCLVLPFLTGQIKQIGNALCPMHLPVFLCAYLCGAPWAAAVGFVAALVAGFSLPLSAIAGSALGAGVIVAALAVQAAAAVLEGLSAKSVKAAN